MLEVTTLAWAATIGAIALLFAVDLLVSRLRPHAVGFREAVAQSLFYIAVALVFGVVLGVIAGWRFGGEYFAGYIVEKKPVGRQPVCVRDHHDDVRGSGEHQQRVLTIGILLALVLRAIFIALGAALLSAFSFMFLIFGLLLIVTAIQLFRHRDEDPSVEDNALVSLSRRVFPVTDEYYGGRLATRVQD